MPALVAAGARRGSRARIPGATGAVASDTTLFRVILKDGTALTSYGSTRVGDRVVFSMPFGSIPAGPSSSSSAFPRVRLIGTTERYAIRSAMRALETRAEEDYRSSPARSPAA
jgi:hypothetical protein